MVSSPQKNPSKTLNMNPNTLPHQPGSQAKTPSPPPFSLTFLGKTRSNSNQQANQLLQTQEDQTDFKASSTYFSATKNGPKKSLPSPDPFIDQSGKPIASNPIFPASKSDKNIKNSTIFSTKSRNPTFLAHFNNIHGPTTTGSNNDTNDNKKEDKNNSDNNKSISFASAPTFTIYNSTSDHDNEETNGLQFKKFTPLTPQQPTKKASKPTADISKSSIRLNHINAALFLLRIISEYATTYKLCTLLFDIQVCLATFLQGARLFIMENGVHDPPECPHKSFGQLHDLHVGNHELLAHRIRFHCLSAASQNPTETAFKPQPLTTTHWPAFKNDEDKRKEKG